MQAFTECSPADARSYVTPHCNCRALLGAERLRFRVRVSRIQAIEHRRDGLEKGVVVGLQRACSGHDRREARTLCRRDAPKVQVMDHGSQAGQSLVLLEPEGCEEHLESHLVAGVSELRSIKIEAYGLLRDFLDALQPEKLRLLIDEAANEPGGGDAIDPEPLARYPGAARVRLRIATADPVTGRVGLIWRESGIERGFCIGQCALHLIARRAREVVTCDYGRDLPAQSGKALPRFILAKLSHPALERANAAQDLLVIHRAVEETGECRLLLGRFALEREQVCGTTGGADFDRLLVEHASGRA